MLYYGQTKLHTLIKYELGTYVSINNICIHKTIKISSLAFTKHDKSILGCLFSVIYIYIIYVRT